MSEYILELPNITKRFACAGQLHNMSFGLRPGEVHAFLGETVPLEESCEIALAAKLINEPFIEYRKMSESYSKF